MAGCGHAGATSHDSDLILRQLLRARIIGVQIVERMESTTGSAKSRLLKLMQAIEDGDLGKYDVPIRAWAAQEPAVARVVKKIDKLRISVVRQLFVDLGFIGQELEMRVITFATFHSLEQGLFERPLKRERKELIKVRHAFFTKPPVKPESK